MTSSKLLSNKRIETLNRDTDYLGIINKGELITQFLRGSSESIEEIKMFALYGDWGSGKSTLMKFIQDELKGEFNTFFFEAWEFEKDENLAMSLLEFIASESESNEEAFYKDVLKYGGRILRGLGKSIKLNIPLFPNGPGIDLDPSAFVEEMTKAEEISFYEALKKFKIEFRRLEDFTTKGENPKYNIVFIDDLDRCEPEQVLNLMSAIKLFFTYGEKTIFFCGIDKSAVEAAVRTKYGKVVKSNEYLEKIFDISFSMPNEVNVQKLINHYFDSRIYTLRGDSSPINYRIDEFFRSIGFYNPRRIKKVLNKYQMLRSFKFLSSDYVENFPNIDLKKNSERSLFETLLVLYLIILHEFYSSDFDNFLNFEKKLQIYSKAIDGYTNNSGELNQYLSSNFSSTRFDEIYNLGHNNDSHIRFAICISPNNIEKIHLNALIAGSGSQIVGTKNSIDLLFFKYINKHNFNDWVATNSSSATFKSVKKLIKDLL